MLTRKPAAPFTMESSSINRDANKLRGNVLKSVTQFRSIFYGFLPRANARSACGSTTRARILALFVLRNGGFLHASRFESRLYSFAANAAGLQLGIETIGVAALIRPRGLRLAGTTTSPEPVLRSRFIAGFQQQLAVGCAIRGNG